MYMVVHSNKKMKSNILICLQYYKNVQMNTEKMTVYCPCKACPACCAFSTTSDSSKVFSSRSSMTTCPLTIT